MKPDHEIAAEKAQRVIDAVGYPPDSYNLNGREVLEHAPYPVAIGMWADVIPDLSNHGAWTRRRKLVADVRKQALKLKETLASGESKWFRSNVAIRFPIGEPPADPRITERAPSYEAFLGGLDLMMKCATDLQKKYADEFGNKPPYDTGDASAFEFLVNKHLGPLYRLIYGSKPRWSRSAKNGGAPNGPFIRFALAMLVEMDVTNKGNPYSAEAIVTALQGTAKRQRRRATKPAHGGKSEN